MKTHLRMAILVLLAAAALFGCGLLTTEPPPAPKLELPATIEVTLPVDPAQPRATLAAALTQAARPTVDLQITLPANLPEVTRLPENEAQAAIHTYARDVLGIDIQVQAGKGLVGEYEIPLVSEVDTAVHLAGVTYFGFWKDGAASLSAGSGSVSGELYADLQDGSLGVFSMRLNTPAPQNSQDALALIQTTYPGLQDFDFSINENYDGGFVFSTAKAQDYDLHGGEFTLTGSMATAGVSPGRRPGISMVWVVVSSGALTAPFQ